MNAKDDALRKAFGHLVATRCATDRSFCARMKIRDDAGRRVIIPTLATDRIDMACRLAVQAGGAGTLVILHEATRRAGLKSTFNVRYSMVSITAERANPPEDGTGTSSDLTLAELLRFTTPGVRMELSHDQERFVVDGLDEAVVRSSDDRFACAL